MSAIPSFDPCKQWLGIDAVDLVSPHRVLGIPTSVTDPLAIVQAADRQLAVLRQVEPGPFGKARDALVARVCEARDGLLQSGRPAAPIASPAAWPPTTIAPPPVPPPVATVVEPEPEPSQPGIDVVPFAPRPVRAPVRRASRDAGPAVVSLIFLLVAAGSLAAYVFKPQLFTGRRPRQVATKPEGSRPPADDTGTNETAAESPAAGSPSAPPAETPSAPADEEPAVKPARPAKPPRKPRPAMPADEDPAAPAEDSAPMPAEPPAPAPDPALQTAALARVDEQLEAAYTALRAEEFDAVTDAIAAAADAAVEAEDQDAVDRVSRWKLLARYAERFPDYRDQAFAAAKAGREYEVNGTKIAVIEVNDEVFVYRVQGQNRRVARNKIPDAISLAIVSTWFAGDGRAANHIFLGVHHLAKPQPDPAAAAREFQTAARGGEDVASLEELLDDPLVTAAADAQ